MRRVDPALLVVIGGVTAALHVGKLPTALPLLRDALGVTLVQAGFLLSLVQLAGMLLGVAVGVAADALGLKRMMLSGMALLSLASVLGGFANDAVTLMVLRAIEGFGFLLASMPAPSLIRRLVPVERVNVALGLWGAYMPLGTALALVGGPVVMAAVEWRGWWWSLGLWSAAVSCALAVLLPGDKRPVAPTAASTTGGWRARLAATLRAPGPWLIALAFAAYSSQWLSLIGFLPTMYAQAGLSAGLAGAATASAAIVNMAGNIAAGRLLQKGVPAQWLLYAGFAAMAVGAALAFASGQVPPLVRYAGALGFSTLGGLIPGTLFSLAVRLAPGEHTVSTTVGWMHQWSAFGQFAGPPLVALVASRAGSWQWSTVVTGAFAFAGLLLANAIGREVRRDRPVKSASTRDEAP